MTPTGTNGWRLGIDFGTTYTVAAVDAGEGARILDVESNGNSRLPSCVFVTADGEILVGSRALHQAPFEPERFEPTPKRAIGEGELFLGDELIPVEHLIAAVFKRVYAEASRQFQGIMPTAVVVTHPADWSGARLDVLRGALDRAGIEAATLLPEPVAAAARIAMTTPVGSDIAVYDFGGGTFDAAVLHRDLEGFVVAGPPAGRDPLGGEDIDRRIITYLGTVIGEQDEAWLALTNPTTPDARRQASELREEVRSAKETLTEVSSCQLWVPGVGRGVQLTRAELEGLIEADVRATIDTLEQALAGADVDVKKLAGIYLVGGSSRIPLVSDMIWRKFEVRPSVQDNPKAVVALGAVAWSLTPQPAAAAAVPDAADAVTERLPRSEDRPTLRMDRPAPGQFVGRLAADLSTSRWAAGSSVAIQLAVEVPGQSSTTLRARDELATAASSAELAEQVRASRAARSPGYVDLGTRPAAVFGDPAGIERSWRQGAPDRPAMLERYLVSGGRALVLAGPDQLRPIADTFQLAPLPDPSSVAVRFVFPLDPAWQISEQIVVRRTGTPLSVMGERARITAGSNVSTYLSGRVADLTGRLSGGREVARSQARVLAGLTGAIATLRWHSRRGVPMLTKLGAALDGDDVYVITISLPHQDQNQFASLAAQIGLNPAAFASAG